MRKNTSTVIEITDYHIKFLQASKQHGKKKLITCELEKIDNHSEEFLSKAIRRMMAHHNVQPDDLGLILPRKLALLKKIRVPSVDEKEVNQMVSLQLVNQIPYALEDVVYDNYVIEKDGAGYTTLLAVIVHKDVVDRYLNLMNTCNVSLNKLMFSSLGVLQGFNQFKKTKTSLKSFVLINIDAGHSELCFIYDDKMHFSRSIDYGSKDLNQVGALKMFEQIRLTIAAYHDDEPGKEVECVYFISQMNEVSLLKEKIEKELSIACEIVRYEDDLPKLKGMKNFEKEKHGEVSLVTGLGYLFDHPSKALNFIPKEVRETKLRKDLKKEVVEFFVLLVSILVLVVGLIGVDIFGKARHLKGLESQLSSTELKAKQSQSFVERSKVFQKQLNHPLIVPDVLYELTQLIPSDISLRVFSLNDSGELDFQGYAKTGTGVNEFQERLVRSPFFSNIRRLHSTRRKIFNMELTDFKISAQISEDGVSQ